jgi:hypothetical protein
MSALPPRLSPLQIVRALRAQKQAGSPADPVSQALCRRALAESLEKRQMLSVTSAHINAPSYVLEGNLTTLYVNATTDHDPAQTSWSLNFGDGTSQTLTVNGNASLTHLYNGDESSAFSVTATVWDAASGSLSYSYYYASGQATSILDAPLSYAGSNYSTIYATEGQAFTSSEVAHFNDADPYASVSDYTASVTWGDSTLPAQAASVVADPAGGFDVVGTHTFAEEGSYGPGTVTVRDDGGASLSFALYASVADAPLSRAGSGTITLQEQAGVPFSNGIVSFFDADQYGVSSDYTVTATWGDGATSAGTAPANTNGGFDAIAGHTYASAGTYTGSMLVHDSGGSSLSVPFTAVATVPTVSVTASDTAAEAGSTPGSFTFTRTGSTTNALAFTYALSGTAAASDYNATDADTGLPVNGTLTIPAGSYSKTVIITPVDDSIPEWTETAIATVTGGSSSTYTADPAIATVEIVDNDPAHISFQDVLDPYRDQIGQLIAVGGDRKEVDLTFPLDAKAGATISLSLSGPASDVALYDAATGGTAVLGGGGPSTVTWAAGSAPTKLYAQANSPETDAQADAGVELTLCATDAPATSRPSNSQDQGKLHDVAIVGSFNDGNVNAGSDLWWFNGESPHNYHVSETYAEQGIPPAAFAGATGMWEVADDQYPADLYDLNTRAHAKTFTYQSNAQQNIPRSMEVDSASYSSEGQFGQTAIKFSLLAIPAMKVGAGFTGTSVPFKVFAPQSVSTPSYSDLATNDNHVFETDAKFKILDQFGNVLPRGVEMHEEFAAVAWTPNVPGEDWKHGIPDFGIVDPSAVVDHYSGFGDAVFAATLPVPPTDQHAGEPVDHNTQYYYVGSTANTTTLGILVETHTIQFYRGKARWI